MHTPTASTMLDAWERGLEQGPVERGLTLLAVASPDSEPVALAALCIGERDRRLLALREALFGPRATALTACPSCGEQVELELSIADLRLPPAAAEPPLTVRADGYELRLRLPDSRDLLAVAAAGAVGAASRLLERCVVEARSTDGAPAVATLPPRLVAEAERRLAEADPQADLEFALTCPACAHAWAAPFDAVAFLWTELDAWAGRLFADVHALASAYGWTEGEILRMGASRRRSYLRMVGA
ncbi:MAG: hypothetical protein JWO66_2563 [Candidatus Eremiobacteraeota bacterium]|nr:hypothetical protein [Candidatus Eremiobacteraeota bacterium]